MPSSGILCSTDF